MPTTRDNGIYNEFHKETHPVSLLNRMRKLIPLKVVLNRTKQHYGDTGRYIASQLKVTLNNLQGAFFDTLEGRVNYHAMKESGSYQEYFELARKLNDFDPFSLHTDNEKKAFWINIYNILIIHGVIEMDIHKSVREVFHFFKRIGYIIGGLFFTPEDIEHGILRGNRPPPGSTTNQFKPSDRRKELAIERLDPRIHFALVCAASSCPPIEFYDTEKIDKQLDVAGRSFINRNGVVIDEAYNILYLSQIFKWFSGDFGKTTDEILDFILTFSSDRIGKYISENRHRMKIKYLPYNWSLNQALR